MTGDFKLELLDPVAAIVSGTNPIVVDSGLPNQRPNTGGSVNVSLSTSFATGTINSSTGAISNIHIALVAYIKGGKIFTVDSTVGHSHTPVQASSVSNACGFRADDKKLSDLANPANSWVEVSQPGPDSTCYTSDDTSTLLVKLSTSANSGGVIIANFKGAVPLSGDTGAIIGFLDGEKNTDGTIAINHRDPSFANPTLLKTVAASTTGDDNVSVASAGISLVYFAMQLNGDTAARLYRYDVAEGAFSPALYSYTSSGKFGDNGSPADASNFYFADGVLVQKIPRSATTAGNTTLLTTLVAGQQVQNLYLTNTRVVGQLLDSVGNVSIFTVPKSATNAGQTELVSQSMQTNFLQAVDPSGLIYINEIVPGPGGATSIALVAHDDAAGSTTVNEQWTGKVDGTSLADARISTDMAPIAVLREPIDTSAQFQTHTLSAINSATGAVINTLGPITNTEFALGFGSGRYVSVRAASRHGSNPSPDNDVYVADIQTANSLEAVSTVDGNDTYIGN